MPSPTENPTPGTFSLKVLIMIIVGLLSILIFYNLKWGMDVKSGSAKPRVDVKIYRDPLGATSDGVIVRQMVEDLKSNPYGLDESTIQEILEAAKPYLHQTPEAIKLEAQNSLREQNELLTKNQENIQPPLQSSEQLLYELDLKIKRYNEIQDQLDKIREKVDIIDKQKFNIVIMVDLIKKLNPDENPSKILDKFVQEVMSDHSSQTMKIVEKLVQEVVNSR
jgi:hypothetical protein